MNKKAYSSPVTEVHSLRINTILSDQSPYSVTSNTTLRSGGSGNVSNARAKERGEGDNIDFDNLW